MGGEVVWNMPNNTYLRMPPAAALNLAGELMRAAGEVTPRMGREPRQAAEAATMTGWAAWFLAWLTEWAPSLPAFVSDPAPWFE